MIQISRGIWSGPVNFIRRVRLRAIGKFYFISEERPCLVWDPNQPGLSVKLWHKVTEETREIDEF